MVVAAGRAWVHSMRMCECPWQRLLATHATCTAFFATGRAHGQNKLALQLTCPYPYCNAVGLAPSPRANPQAHLEGQSCVPDAVHCSCPVAARTARLGRAPFAALIGRHAHRQP
eukprot:353876-Chlamydomonas_euryale.AAC.7